MALEFGWTDLAQRGVPTLLVMEHLDVVEQGLLGVGVSLEALALSALEHRQPALHHGVVLAIAPPTHRADVSTPGAARWSAIALNIVSFTGKMSTESVQLHSFKVRKVLQSDLRRTLNLCMALESVCVVET